MNNEQHEDEPRRPSLPETLVIWPAKFYKKWISPQLGNWCRFEPTCSEYYILAVRKYGIVRGIAYTIWRILRCNPWCRGGHDPP